MIDDKLVDRIHKRVNDRIWEKYSILDMSNLKKHPEGSIKKWQVKLILEETEKDNATDNVNLTTRS